MSEALWAVALIGTTGYVVGHLRGRTVEMYARRRRSELQCPHCGQGSTMGDDLWVIQFGSGALWGPFTMDEAIEASRAIEHDAYQIVKLMVPSFVRARLEQHNAPAG